MLKTIRKFTFEEFLAAISTRNVSFKTLKRVYLGFCLILVDTNGLIIIQKKMPDFSGIGTKKIRLLSEAD